MGLKGAKPAQRWYAIRVRSKFEKITALYLHNRGFEEFLPLYRTRRLWSDRLKTVDLPLFDGYVFCRFPADSLVPILSAPGVVHIVSTGREPAALEDAEIEAIRQVVGAKMPVGPWPYLRTGQRVRIRYGALKGLEGQLVEAKNQFRLVVSVEMLQRSIGVEIDREVVEPIL